MQERTLTKLEYNKIITRLAEFTSFGGGRELAEGLLPSPSMADAVARLAETTEAKDILRLYPLFSLGAVRDIKSSLHQVEIGGVLDTEALLRIADMCRACRLTKTFFSDIKGSYPITSSLGKSLSILKTIETAVEKAIAQDGSINDNASPGLAQIRKKSRVAAQRIKERLDSLIKNPATQKFLQEPIVTIRDNRYVVPVKQEYRAQVPGIVHDMSASGASIFVEPMAVMELNNDLQKLVREEEEEIAAILRGLTLVVGSFADDLTANLAKMAQLDFIFAKARLSNEMDGTAPKINDQGFIRMLKARHPLIDAAQVVPIDVRLERNINAMVITGPNTGGKTVTLKTVGLLTLMALAGLHIPTEDGSDISFFGQIFADIGDEQSIEQNLSTFSSHMVNIINILAAADTHSLVLLDELGAGTDPTEGAALAMAILEHLKKLGAKIVATTHYSELKAFAYNNPGFINASVEFDIATLSPTYRLTMGIPGKSNAFEISRRLGIEEEIIMAATEFVSAEDVQVAHLLANLEDLRAQVAEEKAETQKQAAKIREQEGLVQAKGHHAEAEATEIIRKANMESQKIIAETIAKSETIYKEMMTRMDDEKTAQKAFTESKRKLKTWQEQLAEDLPEPVFEGEAPKKVDIGDYVYLPKLNQHGVVLTLPDSGNEVAVQVGVLKIMIPLADLRLAEEKPQIKSHIKSGQTGIEKSLHTRPEINLHGMDAVSAIQMLEKYLDDAFIANIKTVRVIHGRGMGILRAAVSEYLTKHRLVKGFRAGDYNEGGIGVTVVELDL
jgi:DNA mismatch repair protein MutS2